MFTKHYLDFIVAPRSFRKTSMLPINQMTTTQEKRDARVEYSLTHLNQLKNGFANLPATSKIPELTIFAAGSYARQEASEFSDIDLFFLTSKKQQEIPELNTNSLRLFGQVIEAVEALDFPSFSNDGQYLVLLHTDDILENLGGRTDDHQNYFTARMLLLLEGHCLYGERVFDEVTTKIVESYFQDFPDHRDNFHPRFLLNDICRFWKTLLLNYENKRRFKSLAGLIELDEAAKKEQEKLKIKQKVRNFKLKYSRMTTCFATIAALGSHPDKIEAQTVLDLTKNTPYQRLALIPRSLPDTEAVVTEILDSYAWFLDQTGLSTETLDEKFSDEERRTEMFSRAKNYGDLMFSLLTIIDEKRPELRLFRNLVI